MRLPASAILALAIGTFPRVAVAQAFWYGPSGTGGSGLWFTPLATTGWGCPSPAAPCLGPNNSGSVVYIGFPGFQGVTGFPTAFNGSVSLNGVAAVGSLTLGLGGSTYGSLRFTPPSGSLGVGSGSSLTVAGPLTIGAAALPPFGGSAGSGQLSVGAGGSVQVSGPIVLGGASGAAGTLSVSGGGAQASASGSLDVGQVGSGTVNVQGGGVFNLAGPAMVGFQSSSSGTVRVTGAGSQWNVANFVNLGGGGGSGALTVSGGGSGSSTSLQVSGNFTVTDPGSAFTTGGLGVGQGNARGSLLVDNGALLQNTGVSFVGGLGGSATVRGGGSRWSSGALYVGVALGPGPGASSTLSISNGGVVTSAQEIFVANGGFKGTLTVDGIGSLLSAGRVMDIGNGGPQGGTGVLTITNGGTAASGGDVTAGTFAGGFGTVTVAGAGSRLDMGNNLFIGNQGNGVLTVVAGGLATVGGSSFVASQPGSTGTILVQGPGSQWNTGGSVILGGIGAAGGPASVSVRGGAFGSSLGLQIAGSFTLSDPGSKWNTGGLVLGQPFARGSLLVDNGAVLQNSGVSFVAGLGGSATVRGAGSRWSSGALYIGVGGGSGQGASSSLSITNGGVVTSGQEIFVGNGGAIGLLRVDGPGSLLSAGRVIDMGNGGPLGGTGVLAVSNGGRAASAQDVSIGSNPLGFGTIVLTGAGSSLDVGNNLFVGNSGQGALNVGPGGIVSVGANAFVANQPGSTGSVLVDAASWNTAGHVDIGVGGTGSVKVRNNGAVTAGSMTVGSQGTLNIDPAAVRVLGDFTLQRGGSLWFGIGGATPSLFSQLFVGGFGLYQGNIFLNFMNGFAPTHGNTFDLIFDAGGADFSQATFAVQGLAPGFQYSTSYTNGTLAVTALNNGNVTPEPTSLILFATALAGFAAAQALRRRRRSDVA